MIFTRDQLNKLFRITDHFHEVNEFDVQVIDDELIRVRFSVTGDKLISEEETDVTESLVSVKLT